jgi:predicted phosphoadenosine phosphosulfate sulfurtransferase
MIVGDNYDEKKNQTTLTMLPYGNIVLPDKWTKTSYNQVSKQHYFKNNDSTTVAVAKNQKQKYPFYKSEQSNKDFLTEFTKWESDHFKSQGATVSIIDDQSDKGYILWKAIIEKENINTFYLFGLKGDYAYNFLADSKTWTDEKIKSFLIKLFNDN